MILPRRRRANFEVTRCTAAPGLRPSDTMSVGHEGIIDLPLPVPYLISQTTKIGEQRGRSEARPYKLAVSSVRLSPSFHESISAQTAR